MFETHESDKQTVSAERPGKTTRIRVKTENGSGTVCSYVVVPGGIFYYRIYIHRYRRQKRIV